MQHRRYPCGCSLLAMGNCVVHVMHGAPAPGKTVGVLFTCWRCARTVLVASGAWELITPPKGWTSVLDDGQVHCGCA